MSERPPYDFSVDSKGNIEDAHVRRIELLLTDARNNAGKEINPGSREYHQALRKQFAGWNDDDLLLLFGRLRNLQVVDERQDLFSAIARKGLLPSLQELKNFVNEGEQ